MVRGVMRRIEPKVVGSSTRTIGTKSTATTISVCSEDSMFHSVGENSSDDFKIVNGGNNREARDGRKGQEEDDVIGPMVGFGDNSNLFSVIDHRRSGKKMGTMRLNTIEKGNYFPKEGEDEKSLGDDSTWNNDSCSISFDGTSSIVDQPQMTRASLLTQQPAVPSTPARVGDVSSLSEQLNHTDSISSNKTMLAAVKTSEKNTQAHIAAAVPQIKLKHKLLDDDPSDLYLPTTRNPEKVTPKTNPSIGTSTATKSNNHRKQNSRSPTRDKKYKKTATSSGSVQSDKRKNFASIGKGLFRSKKDIQSSDTINCKSTKKSRESISQLTDELVISSPPTTKRSNKNIPSKADQRSQLVRWKPQSQPSLLCGNVLDENFSKGGISGWTTRSIRNIDQGTQKQDDFVIRTIKMSTPKETNNSTLSNAIDVDVQSSHSVMESFLTPEDGIIKEGKFNCTSGIDVSLAIEKDSNKKKVDGNRQLPLDIKEGDVSSSNASRQTDDSHNSKKSAMSMKEVDDLIFQHITNRKQMRKEIAIETGISQEEGGNVDGGHNSCELAHVFGKRSRKVHRRRSTSDDNTRWIEENLSRFDDNSGDRCASDYSSADRDKTGRKLTKGSRRRSMYDVTLEASESDNTFECFPVNEKRSRKVHRRRSMSDDNTRWIEENLSRFDDNSGDRCASDYSSADRDNVGNGSKDIRRRSMSDDNAKWIEDGLLTSNNYNQ